MMALPQPEPWDRSIETHETSRAYRAFMDYCWMQEARSLRDLVRRYQAQMGQYKEGLGRKLDEDRTVKPPTIYWHTLTDWSGRHQWQIRVQHWDAEQHRVLTEENNKAIADMNRRQAALGMLGQQKATVKLQSLMGTELSITEATRLMDVATSVERVARGEPATIEGHEHSGPKGGPIPIREIVMIRGLTKLQIEAGDGDDGGDGHDGDPGGHGSGDSPSPGSRAVVGP